VSETDEASSSSQQDARARSSPRSCRPGKPSLAALFDFESYFLLYGLVGKEDIFAPGKKKGNRKRLGGGLCVLAQVGVGRWSHRRVLHTRPAHVAASRVGNPAHLRFAVDANCVKGLSTVQSQGPKEGDLNRER